MTKSRTDGEVWKDIPGHEGEYAISNLGRTKVYARWNKGGRNQGVSGRVMPERINLSTSPYGVFIKQCIHRLVAQAFIPNPDNLPEVNHKDGDPSNNVVDNLEWVTRRENALHSTRVLGKNRGSQVGTSLLTEQEVSEIKFLLHDGNLDQHTIGHLYGVTNSTISKINRGHNWPQVQRLELPCP